MKIYVGNLPFGMDDGALEELFKEHGEVHSAQIVMDRDTGRSRGFGFVEMDKNDATKAIEALNETEVGGRTLTVNEARSKGRGDGGGGGRGGGRGRNW
ncbi:MAG: RNA-binding protein [Deltaproteobacteria bacterium]|nr:RNA-binding protein [Deltaproteobacteria bacterium]